MKTNKKNKISTLLASLLLIGSLSIGLESYADSNNSNGNNGNNNGPTNVTASVGNINNTNTNRNTNSNDNRNTNNNDNRNTNNNTNNNRNTATSNSDSDSRSSSSSNSTSTSTGSSSSSNSTNNQTSNQYGGTTNVNVVQLPTLPLGYETIGAVSGSVSTISVQGYGGQNGQGGVAVGIAIPIHSGEYKQAKRDAMQIQHVQLQTMQLQMLSLCEAMYKQQHIITPICAELHQKYLGHGKNGDK